MVVAPSTRHVVLVGPTASGKSAVALELARRTPGIEIVSVDSAAVYRFMDIGTAKPTAEDRTGVAYHLIDMADPSEDYSVARFQRDARSTIEAIERRGSRALLVGGTGLYMRSIVDGLAIPGRWPDLAHELERRADEDGMARLHAQLSDLDPLSAARMEPSNRRRVVRALEVTIGSGRPFSSFGRGLTSYGLTPFEIVGVDPGPDELDRRIEVRLARQLEDGFLDEVAMLAARPAGLSRTARQAAGYRELLAHVEEGRPVELAIEEATRRVRRLARRQRSWFRRDPRVHWVDRGMDPGALVGEALRIGWPCAY